MSSQIGIKIRYDISRESILPSKKERNNNFNNDISNKQIPIPNSVCSHKTDSQTINGSPPNEFMLLLTKRMDSYFSFD
jgi:hypothetical protein